MHQSRFALTVTFAVAAAFAGGWLLQSGTPQAHAQSGTRSGSGEPTRLAVLWTSGDPDVAHRVGLMYTHATRRAKWFDETKLIVWGPSARLLAADKDVQAKVKQMMADGVDIQACIVCADSYGVTEDLRALGIEVKPMGKPLSDLVKDDGWDVLTF